MDGPRRYEQNEAWVEWRRAKIAEDLVGAAVCALRCSGLIELVQAGLQAGSPHHKAKALDCGAGILPATLAFRTRAS